MNNLFGKVIAIAFLVEVLTNFIKTLVPNINRIYIPVIAGIFGIVLAWTGDIGIFSTLDIPIKWMVLDYMVTGILVSRGANLVHDLAKTLNYSP